MNLDLRQGSAGHRYPDIMRPSIVITLGILMLAILAAGVVQFFFLA